MHIRRQTENSRKIWHAGIIAKLQQYFMQDDLASLVDDIHKMRKRVQAGAPPPSDLKKRLAGFWMPNFLSDWRHIPIWP